METVDRMHHICLTVNSENWRETWPKQMAFFVEFLRMNAYYIAVNEFPFEAVIQGMKGMGLGPQEIEEYYPDGTPRTDYFFYLAGEDMSAEAGLVDLIVFVTRPGQITRPQPNMHTLGLRGMTLLVDNIDAIYQRGLEEGHEFLSAPVTQEWGEYGEVKFVVVKDIVGNPVELVQTSEFDGSGDGKVIRIFSNNQNTQAIDKALAFYRDGCGMTVESVAKHSGADFTKAMALPEGTTATTYFLRGTNPSKKTTLFALTSWDNLELDVQQLEGRQTPSYYRQWFWVEGKNTNVQALFDKMRPEMVSIGAEPYSYTVTRPWSDATMSFFNDYDGVKQEFANHEAGVTNEWKGLGVLVDDPEFGHNFDKKNEWLEKAKELKANA